MCLTLDGLNRRSRPERPVSGMSLSEAIAPPNFQVSWGVWCFARQGQQSDLDWFLEVGGRKFPMLLVCGWSPEKMTTRHYFTRSKGALPVVLTCLRPGVAAQGTASRHQLRPKAIPETLGTSCGGGGSSEGYDQQVASRSQTS